MSFFTDGTNADSAPVPFACSRMHRLRAVRPSVLDPDLAGEPSLAPCICMPQVAVLYVVNRPVAIIQATSLDQAALESWLASLRMRPVRVPIEV